MIWQKLRIAAQELSFQEKMKAKLVYDFSSSEDELSYVYIQYEDDYGDDCKIYLSGVRIIDIAEYREAHENRDDDAWLPLFRDGDYIPDLEDYYWEN